MEKGILFIDTETTGMLNFNAPAEDPSQPRMVQLAAILNDSGGNRMAELCCLIKPDGWTIPPAVQAIHGITTEQCDQFGMFAGQALSMVGRMIDCATWPAEIFEGKPKFCTMLKSTDICKIPSPRGRGFKWPKLEEAYLHFLKTELKDAHDAMHDVRACEAIYYAMNPKPVAVGAGS